MADAYASSETITAEATTMRLLRMPRLHNQKLTKPDVHSIARTLIRCTYAKIAAEVVERRKHSDDMKAFALKLAARTVLPVGIVVLRKTNGVEHRLELHSHSLPRPAAVG